MCRLLSDSSFLYRCQIIELLNSCQNKFGLFLSVYLAKKSVGNVQSQEVYFSQNSNTPYNTQTFMKYQWLQIFQKGPLFDWYLLDVNQGPSLYWVNTFLDIFWPTHPTKTWIELNFSKNCQFLTPPNQSPCLRWYGDGPLVETWNNCIFLV